MAEQLHPVTAAAAMAGGPGRPTVLSCALAVAVVHPSTRVGLRCGHQDMQLHHISQIGEAPGARAHVGFGSGARVGRST